MLADNANNVRTLRGVLIMIAGVALLLHTLGWVQVGLSFVLIVVALSAIVYGMYISGLYAYLRDLMGKRSASSTNLEHPNEPTTKRE